MENITIYNWVNANYKLAILKPNDGPRYYMFLDLIDNEVKPNYDFDSI